MNVLDVLRAARTKLADEDRWTQGANARNRYGLGCASQAPEAICWCMRGAVLAVATGLEMPIAAIADQACSALGWTLGLPGTELHHFNDSTDRSHAAVLQVFDITIERISA